MIDIIIPSLLKTPKILSWTINQALNSEYINQIIIIDNTQQNAVKQLISNHNKISILTQGKNIYVNPAWNLGAEMANSKYLLFMNDDVYADHRIYKYVHDVMSNENAGLCSVSAIQTDSLAQYELQFNNNYQQKLKTTTRFAYRARHFNMDGSFFCIPKNIWKPIPTNLKLLWGDVLIYKRIRLLGYDTLNITNVLIGHRPHSTINSIRKELKKIKKQDYTTYIQCREDYCND